jgi:hypothetical protein
MSSSMSSFELTIVNYTAVYSGMDNDTHFLTWFMLLTSARYEKKKSPMTAA